MNALKQGVLTGFRDNRNRWQIKSEDLSTWLSIRTDTTSEKGDNTDSQRQPAPDENALRIAVMEAELKAKDQRIFDLERDRDDWKSQAQELVRRDTFTQAKASSRPRRWWPF